MNRILKLRGIALIASLLAFPVSAIADERENSRAEMRERWESMSEEERQAAREQHGGRGGRAGDMSDEERQAMRERWESMSEEERAEMRAERDNRRGGGNGGKRAGERPSA
jgi:hypothetical protein